MFRPIILKYLEIDMAKFCFFTYHTLLHTQVDKPFGPVVANPNTAYRLQNLHSGSSPLPAFAITQGEILVQEVSASLVNIVLKPGIQPDFDFPKIEYIIYKGVLKSSLINGTEVASEGTNDLTRSIWQAQNKRNEKVEAETDINPMETPNANCLGINYTDVASAPFEALDDSPLDLAFFNNSSEFQLPSVQKGWEIGEFDSSSFGVLIAFERIGQPHTFELARELDSILTVSALGGAPTQVETFEHNHDKEKVLSFLDDTAFFGAFYSGKLDVKIGAEFEEKSEEEIYDLFLNKYLNKNAVYIDLRNEFDTSFDYYLNYGREIKASFTDGGSTTTLNFYRDNWPILKLNLADFSAGNSSDRNFINLSLPQGSNSIGLVYLAKAFRDKRNFKKLRYKKKFEVFNFSGGSSDEFTLITPNKVAGETTSIANYYHLVYIKKQVAPNGASDFSPEKSHHVDFFFPIFSNSIPFQGTSGVVKYKTYDNLNHINTFDKDGLEYMASVCIAQDDYNFTFLASPKCYLQGPRVTVNPSLSLVGEEIRSNAHFLNHLEDKLKKTGFFKVDVVIGGSMDQLQIQKEKLGLFTTNIFDKHDPDYPIVIIEKNTFTDLFSLISASSIIPKYGVWLYFENQLHTTDDNDLPITEFTLGFSGLKHLGSNLSRENVTTIIKIYANDHI